MLATYKTDDGTERGFFTPANRAVYDKICKKEIYADLTSVVQGCLDADAMCDTDKVLKSSSLLNRNDKHECPYCCEGIGEEDKIEDLDGFLEEIWIDYDELNPEAPYMCPICGAMHATEEAARKCCSDKSIYICSYCDSLIQESELLECDVPVNAQQWLLVSEWLGTCLAAMGESVLETDEGAFLWAREKTNPAPNMDLSVIHVCQTVGILEGQKNYKEVKV